MSDAQTPTAENLEPLFALSDIADPAVFLAGAVIPLAPRPALSMPPTNAYFWCRDHLIISDSEEGAAMRINSADVDIFDVLMVDLSDPDVARWVDRRIVETLWPREDGENTPVYEACIIIEQRANGATFVMTYRESDGQSAKGRLDVALDIPRMVANIPKARAAILRSLFGSANV